MNINRKFLASIGIAAALVVAACGSNNNDDVAATPAGQVPDSAGASSASFVGYLLTLGVNDESSEPLTVRDGFEVPADETADPAPFA